MRQGTREDYENRILRVQLYIQNHLDNELSLDELANVACFSPFHFHRIFRGMVGESVKEYVRRNRLKRAAMELEYSKRPVTQIAFDAGYETHESFTRAFRGMYNVPPKKFRENHQNGSNQIRGARDGKFETLITRTGDESMKEAIEVKIEKFPARTVASVRHIGPYNQCQGAWQKLCSNKAVAALIRPDIPSIGICYDDPDSTDPDKIRYDACIQVGDDFTPDNGITKQQIEAGDFAVMTHKGSYDTLNKSYKWLYGQWLPSSGREPKYGPSLEFYRNCSDNTPPEELITDICIPLK
ncbi:MAG: AraC family transcriptional regulator [candidate division Zixibacteria bacterium]|nr:AraC family transcriptional regulator [candidate division Zixibacteria bacterium]